MIKLILGIGLLVVTSYAENTRLKEIFNWKTIDYVWEKPEDRQAALDSKEYIPSHNLPLGLDVWKDKLFITVPRWKSGVLSSVNYVNISDKNPSPQFIPYPDRETNRLVEKPDTPHITSTFRVRVDRCNRLWVMDTGLADILGEPKVYSKAQILIYNLLDDKLIRSYPLKTTDIKDDTFFANIVVDDSATDCENAFAYIPDLGRYAIVVYDFKNNDSWRVEHHYFHMDPLAGDLNVGGVNFQWTDGVFALALAKPAEDGSRTVYFHPLASTKEFQVNSRVLQNKTHHDFHSFKIVGDRGENSQSTASFLDLKSNVLFYTQINKDGVGCWNSNKPLSPDNVDIVSADNSTLVFPNDLKVDYENNLWLLVDKLPLFIYRGLDSNDTNYRILKASVPDAVKGTKCAA